MRRSTRIVVAGGAALALLAGGTAAGAAIAGGPVSSDGVIYGCYTTKPTGNSHNLVLQNVGTTCPKGDTAVQWNQQGPAGATGATGQTGATGPAGPAASSLQIAETQVSVPSGASAGTTISGEADCPSGQFMLSGGFLDLPSGWQVNSASGAELTSGSSTIPGGFYFAATAQADAQGGSSVTVRAFCVPDS